MNDTFLTVCAICFAVVERSLALVATLHAVLKKRETDTVLGWVGLIWLSPLLGTFLYFLFGVNRIQRKGHKILDEIKLTAQQAARRAVHEKQTLRPEFEFDTRLASVGRHVTGESLLPGNRIIPLLSGDEAYAAMLNAISQAQSTIGLCSYIFDYDRAGCQFIDALVAAQARGVEVRVLIDDVGSRYSNPSAINKMRERGLRVHSFLPTGVPLLAKYANLRNHRKILVVDGVTGFTGGMNIREACLTAPDISHAIQDLHFQMDGPVVEDLQGVFLADWFFVTNEELPGEKWFGQPAEAGDVWARGIPDGPDANFDHMRLMLLGAITAAHQKLDIVTPYFLPDLALVSALKVAAMRGVKVRILLPSHVNIRAVQWASIDPISRLLERGVQVALTPPPFDHTKLMLVDHDWSLVGSSNWDPRSLRLNFEFNVECYGSELNRQLTELVDRKIETSTLLTQEILAARHPLEKIRDGIARLATPYL